MSGHVYYPDGASYQAGINLAGWLAYCAKATQGTSYVNPSYQGMRAEAARHGAFFAAYHFLMAGNAAAQADHCFSVVGRGVPLMIDDEPTAAAAGPEGDGHDSGPSAEQLRRLAVVSATWQPGQEETGPPRTAASNPSVTDAAVFTDRYRALGGTCHQLYLPRWYWVQLGRPSLSGLAARGLHLVTSYYSGSPEDGRAQGWQTYGGMPPVFTWQYTANGTVNGMAPCDMNCFRGSGGGAAAGTLAEMQNLWMTGSLGGTPPAGDWTEEAIMALPTLQEGARDPVNGMNMVHRVQIDVAGIGRWNNLGAVTAIDDDGVWGPATTAGLREIQRFFGVTDDGVAGPDTWRKLIGVLACLREGGPDEEPFMPPPRTARAGQAIRPQPGDFAVVTEPGSPVEQMQRLAACPPRYAKYVHAFRLVSGTPLEIVEAMPGGTVRVPLHYPPQALWWSAGIIPTTDAQRTAIIAAACGYAAAKVGYSFLDYLAIAAHSWHLPAPGLREYIRATGHMTCGQEVDQESWDAGQHLFTDRRWPGYSPPFDLAKLLGAP